MPVDSSKKHVLVATLIPYLLNTTPSLPIITQEETGSMSQIAPVCVTWPFSAQVYIQVDIIT